MRRYDLIGLAFGSLIGILLSLYLIFYMPPRLSPLQVMIVFFFPLAFGGWLIGFYVNYWKGASEKYKGKEIFKEGKIPKELSPKQKNYLNRLIYFQKRFSLALILITLSTFVFLQIYLHFPWFYGFFDLIINIIYLVAVAVFLNQIISNNINVKVRITALTDKRESV